MVFNKKTIKSFKLSMECVSIPKEFLNQLAMQLADMRLQLVEANKKIEELSKKKTKKVKVIETADVGS